jgi:hypothetical protein
VKFERVTNKLPNIIINAQKVDTSTTTGNDVEIEDENNGEDSQNNNDRSKKLVEVKIKKMTTAHRLLTAKTTTTDPKKW